LLRCACYGYLREMVRLFLGNRPGVLLLLPFIIATYALLNLKTGYYGQEDTTNLGVWGETVIVYPVFLSISAAVLVFINAVGINWIYNSNEFLERNSYMPALLYVVLMSFYHSFYSIDGLLITHTLMIFMMHQLFHLNQHEDGRRNVFNGMFFAGAAATFHPPLIAMFPILCFMIWVIRPFILREFMLAILGFCIPLIYGGIFMWMSGHGIELKLLEQITDYTNKQTDFLVTAVLFTLLFLLSLLSLRSRMQKSTMRLRKLSVILRWYIFMALILGSIDFFLFRQIERFSFVMIPLAVFLPFAFINKTFGYVGNLLFYITLTYSVAKFFL
jgi:hypothetical protein